jgi:hypothetical protein
LSDSTNPAASIEAASGRPTNPKNNCRTDPIQSNEKREENEQDIVVVVVVDDDEDVRTIVHHDALKLLW